MDAVGCVDSERAGRVDEAAIFHGEWDGRFLIAVDLVKGNPRRLERLVANDALFSAGSGDLSAS